MEISQVEQEWCTLADRFQTDWTPVRVFVRRLVGASPGTDFGLPHIEPDWERRRAEHSEMLQVGRDYLAHASLIHPGIPYLLLLCDREAVVLEKFTSACAFGAKIELGESFAGEHAGENAVGMAVVSGCHAVMIGENKRVSSDCIVSLGLPLKDEDGNLHGVLGCVAPLQYGTPAFLRHLFSTAFGIEREMVLRKRLLRQRRDHSIMDLASKAVHEVRNPLTAMRAAAQLGKVIDDPIKRGELFDRIMGEIDRLNDFLGNLLQLLRPTASDLKPDSPARVVEDVLAVFESRLQSVGIELSYHVSPDLPQVPINAGLLHRALFNIIKNAIEAMLTGGTLRIALRAMADRRSVRIDIQDTGAGIPSGAAELVFQSFFTTKPQGTGLGLAIAHQIITEGHHGRIWFETVPEGGTTFHIELPGASTEGPQHGRNFATGA